MYEVIFFNFDYTLGDSTNGFVLSINDALNKLGYDEKEAVIFTKYFKEKADKVMIDNTTLYEGVREKLLKWKQRCYTIHSY